MKTRLALLILPLAMTAQAQPSSCSSDGVPPPAALLERFIDADCAGCWSDPRSPEPAAGAVAIDWVTPGSRGDDAPLSAVATRDAQERLDALRKPPAAGAATHFSPRIASPFTLRIAHGLPVNDYIGAALEVAPPPPGHWKAWLLLVETLPRGTAGSPVERNLVRNAYVSATPGRYEIRSMQIHEGARAQRLRLVAWLEDSHGRVGAIAQTRCRTR